MSRSREALEVKDATELRSLLLESEVMLVVRLRRNSGLEGAIKADGRLGPNRQIEQESTNQTCASGWDQLDGFVRRDDSYCSRPGANLVTIETI